jgi:uncharacterized protein (DUF2147 family)
MTEFARTEFARTEFAMTMLRTALVALGLSAIAVSIAAPARAAEATGIWYTAEQKSQVRITNCGGALCGALVWLKEPNDPDTGRPRTDKNNPDASKQSRPLIGVQIVLAMKPSGTPNQWSGDVYNAEDGKTYSGSFTMTGPNTAELKGCVLGGLICKTQSWTRAN